MMKVEAVDDVYFRLNWCRLSQVELGERPLNRFVFVVSCKN